MMPKKPTIEELEKMLNDPEEHPIQIQPDGSLKVDRRKKGKVFIERSSNVLTMNQDFVSSY